MYYNCYFPIKEKYNIVEQSTPFKQILLQMESTSLGLGMRLGWGWESTSITLSSPLQTPPKK